MMEGFATLTDRTNRPNQLTEPAGFDGVRFALNIALATLSPEQQLALARRAMMFCREAERHALERLGGSDRGSEGGG